MNNYINSLKSAQDKLSEEKHQRFSTIMQHGTMRLEYFAPFEKDTQKPHAQDELYFVISGNAILERAGENLECKDGDVIFVPAGMIHRFINFSVDFATWVIFYGEDGGENSGE